MCSNDCRNDPQGLPGVPMVSAITLKHTLKIHYSVTFVAIIMLLASMGKKTNRHVLSSSDPKSGVRLLQEVVYTICKI
jgi:hypothetical protein